MNGVAKENRENGYILESFQPEQEQNIFPPIFDTQRYGRPNNSLLVDSWMYKESDAILKVDANCQSFQPNNALENALAVSVVKNVLPATCFTQQYTNHIPAKIKQR
ncbi:hypothetical protein AX774_g6372 [Zancudomyces culisetae]|uniref:Uncharacterized protein n=1 Tax=Zancudomyces culisetae TaxID=1213189 RepID=A0A1R1PH04_ZANCU|nr:hypothetical protein AX774_g6372 [Zancudomyces culisetae]|eukprot:OMH80193.1 hypothetical protein AX774_g6372 [Zancudomyces culisetae]